MLNTKYSNAGSAESDEKNAEEQELSIYEQQESFLWRKES